MSAGAQMTPKNPGEVGCRSHGITDLNHSCDSWPTPHPATGEGEAALLEEAASTIHRLAVAAGLAGANGGYMDSRDADMIDRLESLASRLRGGQR